MKEHGITYHFQFDNATRRFGYCDLTDRLISLSKPLVELNSEERVRNTILHEIAHALAPRGSGHDWQWKIIATKIGCDARRTYDKNLVNSPPPKYKAVCERHNLYIPRRIKKTTLACGRCCKEFNNGKYSNQYLFKWITV